MASYRKDLGLPAAFIPCGPITSASSRLQVYLPHRWLSDRMPGEWMILRRPRNHRLDLGKAEALRIFLAVLRRGVRTVILQKVHRGSAKTLMAALGLLGRRVIYVEADERRKLAFTRHVDALVAPSQQLADDLQARTGHPTIAVIPDPLEYWSPASVQTPWKRKPPYRTLWIGSARNWHQLIGFKDMLEQSELTDFQLITISDHPEADLPWSLDTVRDQIELADLGIIPTSSDNRSAMKSHNRATLFMSLGVPILVSDGPIYAGLVRDGETGFVYRDASDLTALPGRLSSPGMVDAIRRNAMKAAEAYSLDRIGPMWHRLVTGDALSQATSGR